MYPRERAEFFSKVKHLRSLFSGIKNDLNIDKKTLYLSDHLADRIVERNLYKDKEIIAGMTKWFYREVFKNVTYSSRSYLVEFRKLNLGISIELTPGIDSEPYRRVVVKTAFENELKYECDEKLIIK